MGREITKSQTTLTSFILSLSLPLPCPCLSFQMSLSPVSCISVPLVHFSRLEELIAGLTALAQYTAQLLPGPHRAQPSHRAIRAPSRFLHPSPLLCHSPTLHQGRFVSHPSLDLSPTRTAPLSSISHHFPFTSILPHPSPIFSFPSPNYAVSPSHFTLSSHTSCHLAPIKVSGQ